MSVEILHDAEGLLVRLVVDDDEETARVEIETAEGGPDLTEPDEVVVALDGEVCELQVEGPRRAVAMLPEPAEDAEEVTLMVRVHEFFEGWEFY